MSHAEEKHAEQRAAVVAEARSWLRTPWHHRARVKGAGVDCGQFLIGVAANAGLMPAFDTGHYPPDWHLHRDEPRFLDILRRYADPFEQEPLPGDVAMFRYGRHAAHGSIIVAWPLIVHAWRDQGMVVESDVSVTPGLAARFAGFWRLKELA